MRVPPIPIFSNQSFDNLRRTERAAGPSDPARLRDNRKANLLVALGEAGRLDQYGGHEKGVGFGPRDCDE